MKKINRLLFYFCMILCITACTDRHAEIVKQVRDFLEDKYHEKFEVTYWYELTVEQPRHELYAWPVKNKKMEFPVYIEKKKGVIKEYYQDAVWSYEATTELKKHLQSSNIRSAILVLAGVPNSADIIKKGKIISFQETTTLFPGYHPGVVIDLYIFKEYNRNEAMIIGFLQEILNFYKGRNISEIRFAIEFYDESFLLKNMDIDTLSYCFGGNAPPKPHCFEEQYLKQYKASLNFAVINGNPLPPKEELEKLIK